MQITLVTFLGDSDIKINFINSYLMTSIHFNSYHLSCIIVINHSRTIFFKIKIGKKLKYLFDLIKFIVK